MLIGIIVPVILYVMIYLVLDLSGITMGLGTALSEKVQIMLVAVNAILMRQFLVKRNQERTGRGILLITFAMVIAHLIYYYT